MKKRLNLKIVISAAALSLFLSIGAVSYADVRLDTNINNPAGSSYSVGVNISVGEDGYVYAAWQDQRNGKWDIYFNYSDDHGKPGTWQANDIKINANAAGVSNSGYPYMSSDKKGNVYIIWRDDRNSDGTNENFDIYFNYSPDHGAADTWQESDIRINTVAQTGAGRGNHMISSDESGHVYVVWTDTRDDIDNRNYSNVYFRSARNFGATWEPSDKRINTFPPYGKGDAAYTWLSCNEQGYVYIAYSKAYAIISPPPPYKGYMGIFFNYSSNHGESFQTSDIPASHFGNNPGTDTPGFKFLDAMCSDENGHVYIAWRDDRGPSDVSLYFNYSSNHGALYTWQTWDRRISSGLGKALEIHLDCDDSDRVYAILTEHSGIPSIPRDVYFKRSINNGNTWPGNEIRLSPVTDGSYYYYRPKVCYAGNGRLYAVWQRRDLEYSYSDVYLRSSGNYGATWPANLQMIKGIEPGTSDSRGVVMDSDGNGKVYVAWEDDRNGEGDIYFYSKTMGISLLTIKSAGAGSGTIKMDGVTITSLPHTVEIPDNIPVTLRAIPEPGTNSVFAGWTGVDNGTTSPITFTVEDDMEVIANFEIRRNYNTILGPHF